MGALNNIVVACPSVIGDYDSNKLKDLLPVKKWYTTASVVSDLDKICNGLNISITKNVYIRSEFNTSFPSDSVFANYLRKLKSGTLSQEEIKSYDIEKAKYFSINANGKDTNVAISVFPYRNGSKVVYGFYHTYTLFGDGTKTYHTDDAKITENIIKTIAND
jgi:hypothetical protein